MKPEQELLQGARSLEGNALAAIYDQYSPRLYRYALRLLGDASTAEDCVAETFSRFLQALQANKGPRDYLQAYLFRAAHNIIADHYRRRPVIEELDESQPDESNTEESARLNLRQRHVRTALRELTDESTTPCQLTGSCFLIERTCAYYGFCAGKHSICALSMYST